MHKCAINWTATLFVALILFLILQAPILLAVNFTRNVGIKHPSPNAELDVAGDIFAEQICDETGANCKDISSGWSGGGGSVPTGAVMAFDLTSCPSGWSEYTALRGRFVRGVCFEHLGM